MVPAAEYRTRKQVKGLRKTVAVCSAGFPEGSSAEAVGKVIPSAIERDFEKVRENQLRAERLACRER